MDTTRRDFLRQSAAYAVIVGFSDRWLSAQGPASRPAAWTACLEQMKKESKPGLVIRFPNDGKGRARLVKALEDCLRPSYHISEKVPLTYPNGRHVIPPEAVWVFLGSVVVAMESAGVDRLVGGAKPADTLLLVDAKGVRLDGAAMNPNDLYEPEKLLAALEALLSGPAPARERLQARADGAYMPKMSYLCLFDDTPENIRALHTNYEGKDVLAILIHERARLTTAESRDARASLIANYYAYEPQPLRGHSLPFGVEVAPAAGPAPDPCPTCGLAAAPAPARLFVGILREGESQGK